MQQAGDLAGARAAYESALKFSPRRIDALSNLGLVYAGLHDYSRAVQSFRRALDLAAGQPVVLFNLGITYLQAGQFENARGTLAQVVEANPANYAARHYLGLALLKLGRKREGIPELERAVEGQPADLDAAYTLASAYVTDKQFQKAAVLIDAILRKHDTAEAHLLAGSYLLAAQKYKEAVDELRQARQMNPALPEVASKLGEGYAMTGSRDAATQVFEEHLKANPSDFDALAFLGWLYLESDRTDKAAALLNKARQIKPDDPDVLFQLGRIAREQGNFEGAAALLERVVALKPGYTQAHVLLAQTYFRIKRREDGQKEQEIVKRLNEQDRLKRLQETALPAPDR